MIYGASPICTFDPKPIIWGTYPAELVDETVSHVNLSGVETDDLGPPSQITPTVKATINKRGED